MFFNLFIEISSTSRNKLLSDKEFEQLLMKTSDDETHNDFFGGEDSDNDQTYVTVQFDAGYEQSIEDEIEEELALSKSYQF